MESQFWHQRWASNQIGFHQSETHPLLQRHWSSLDPKPGDGVFVPLCGKTRDLWWLKEQAQRPTGVELSPVAVEAFYAEAGVTAVHTGHGALERWSGGEITLFSGDFFALRPEDVADCKLIYDRASLIALPAAMRQAYAAHLRLLFPQGTRMLLIALEYSPSGASGPPFSVSDAEVRELFRSVEVLASDDMLAANPQFGQRGVTKLHEITYRIAL